MSNFMKMDLPNTPELETLPSGEAKLRVTGVNFGMSEKEHVGEYAQLRVMSIENPNAKPMTDFVGFANDNQDEAQQMSAQRKFKEVCLAFGVPLVEVESMEQAKAMLEDCIGEEGWAILTEKTSEEYGKQNNIRRWLPRH